MGSLASGLLEAFGSVAAQGFGLLEHGLGRGLEDSLQRCGLADVPMLARSES